MSRKMGNRRRYSKKDELTDWIVVGIIVIFTLIIIGAMAA